jgi:hypothetical protein
MVVIEIPLFCCHYYCASPHMAYPMLLLSLSLSLKRSRRMAPDYEISMMSPSGLPYRTHTLPY